MTSASQERKLINQGYNSVGDSIPYHKVEIPDKHWEIGREITPIDVAATFYNLKSTAEYEALNLPNGVSIDPVTGIISGTPTEYITKKAICGLRVVSESNKLIKTNNFKTYRGPIAGGLDRDKIYVVYNTSVAESEVIADYYIAKRHLKPENKIGFAFGTGTTWDATVGTPLDDVIHPLAEFTEGAHAIITSAFTPYRTRVFKSGATQASNLIATAGFLGWCGWHSQLNVIPDIQTVTYIYYESISDTLIQQYGFPLDIKFAGRSFGSGSGGSNYSQMTRQQETGYLGNSAWAFGGRLGYPTINESGTETVSEVQRIIDDAIDNEKSYASAIAEGSLANIHLGANDRAKPWITGYECALAGQDLDALGLPVRRYKHIYDTNYNITYTVDYLGSEMSGTYGSTCLPNTQTLAVREDLWGHLDQALCNVVTAPAGEPTAWPNSYNIQPGAWGAYPTSVGTRPGVSLIINGGCCFIGCVAEPLADKVTVVQAFNREILSGKTMVEAMQFSNYRSAPYRGCFGDPLYAPFGREFD